MPRSTLRHTPRDVPRKTRGQDGFADSFPVGLLRPLQYVGLSRRTVHDRLIDSKPKGNTQFDSLDDGCGQFAISDLPSWLPDARQISSFGRGDCENFSSTFAEHLHSEVVQGERRPQPYKERYQWQATSKPSMQMR
jgi:hypothetical protein